DVAFDPNLALQAADELLRLGFDGDELSDGFAALRDHDAFRIEFVEDRKAAFLEFRCSHGAHDAYLPCRHESCPVRTSDQFERVPFGPGLAALRGAGCDANANPHPTRARTRRGFSPIA